MNEDHALWVARDDGGLARGFVHACAEIGLLMDPRAEIRERGMSMIRVRTNIVRIETHEFYARRG